MTKPVPCTITVGGVELPGVAVVAMPTLAELLGRWEPPDPGPLRYPLDLTRSYTFTFTRPPAACYIDPAGLFAPDDDAGGRSSRPHRDLGHRRPAHPASSRSLPPPRSREAPSRVPLAPGLFADPAHAARDLEHEHGEPRQDEDEAGGSPGR